MCGDEFTRGLVFVVGHDVERSDRFSRRELCFCDVGVAREIYVTF